jgi:hypothetical protein
VGGDTGNGFSLDQLVVMGDVFDLRRFIKLYVPL